MTDREAAWLAGIIDGEGCITARRCIDEGGNPQLSVTNTDKTIIEECMRIAQVGRIYSYNPYGMGKRMRWDWIVVGYRAQDVIRAILPYMIGAEKRRRAELALVYLCHPTGKHLTVAQRLSRENVVSAIIGKEGCA